MSTTTLVLVLGLAFLLVMLVLGVFVLRSGGQVQGELSAGDVGLKVSVGRTAKAAVVEHLRSAVEERGSSAGTPEAERRLRELRSTTLTRTLWVDDNPSGNLYEHLMLRDLGFVISQATSTAEAERYLAAGRFDLVITDLTRDRDGGPEAGLQLIRVVKGRDPDMPVIVYAFEPGDRAEHALRAGAAAVVTTPAELLSAALAQVTGR